MYAKRPSGLPDENVDRIFSVGIIADDVIEPRACTHQKAHHGEAVPYQCRRVACEPSIFIGNCLVLPAVGTDKRIKRQGETASSQE